MTGTPTNQDMTVGELARRLRLNPRTLRYYERIGVLPPARRSRAGYRLYGPADVERLAFIGKAKRLGLTLDEIKEILALRDADRAPCDRVSQVAEAKLAAIEEQLRALTELRGELQGLLREAQRARRDGGVFCDLIEAHDAAREHAPRP